MNVNKKDVGFGLHLFDQFKKLLEIQIPKPFGLGLNHQLMQKQQVKKKWSVVISSKDNKACRAVSQFFSQFFFPVTATLQPQACMEALQTHSFWKLSFLLN
jgi:hypothetical protein